MTARFLELQGITITHKPAKTMRRLISNPKGKLKMDGERNVTYETFCVGQTGRSFAIQMHGHILATRCDLASQGSERMYVQSGHNLHCGSSEHKTFKRAPGSLASVRTIRQQSYWTGPNIQSPNAQNSHGWLVSNLSRKQEEPLQDDDIELHSQLKGVSELHCQN